MIRRFALLPLLALALVASACGGASDENEAAGATGDQGGGADALSLVAYSTPQVVYDEIIPDFRATAEGKGVEFKTSFGASGEQSRAVEAGLKADVVSFSVEPDMERLVEAGIVEPTWRDNEHKGLVTTSVVSFIVRKGNPKNIRTWEDLLEPGVEVITPNPFTSGAAKWNILAAYGHGGLDYVRELLTEHVKVQPKSGREALQDFVSGQGDVLLSYEYEATTAQKKGEELDYVIPDDTIRIDITFAITKDAPAEAQAFADHVLSEAGQERFADWGYRPVDEAVLAKNKSRFPTPKELYGIERFGGWEKVNTDLFDPDTGSIAKIEEELGVPTDS
jgi:sulfate transport system substrate-binding protein